MNTKSSTQSDHLTRFLFEDLAVRGEIVVLSKTHQAIIENHHYPEPVKHLLGELLVITCLLTATLKFEGNITVQLHGDGPLNLAVINGNNHQQMRGIARVKGEIKAKSSLKEMIGKGYMVITIAQNKGKPYQGIINLENETLSDCIENYFMQSEQIPTKLFLRLGHKSNHTNVGGILLQVLPPTIKSTDEFNHIATLTETLKSDELFTLPSDEMLYRLYHQEKVRLFDSQPVSFCCGCSRERYGSSLITLSEEDITAILTENETVDLVCDYCGKHYIFDENDIEKLKQNRQDANGTLH